MLEIWGYDPLATPMPAGTTLVTPAAKFLVLENTARKELHPLEFTSKVAAKFLVLENTARKELHPLEFTSKVTTEFAYNGTSRDCIKNVITDLTL